MLGLHKSVQLTFGIAFSERIAVVHSVALFRTHGHAAEVLVEIQKEDFFTLRFNVASHAHNVLSKRERESQEGKSGKGQS